MAIRLALILSVVGLIVLWNSFFILPVTQKGVLLQFGEIARMQVNTGLNFKIPMIQQVKRFSAKVLTVDGQPHTYLTKENEVLDVDSFVKWRVADELVYYRATGGDQRRAERLLLDRVDAELRNEFGSRSKMEVVSAERDEILTSLLLDIREDASDELGVEVVDVRINRIELPAEARASVHRRMASERQRLANEARAEGREISETIRSEADRARVVLLAEANRDAEILRGQGDANAAKIYAEAYEQDTDFFALVRSLNAYREAFSGENDLLVLAPDGDFFRYLKSTNPVDKRSAPEGDAK